MGTFRRVIPSLFRRRARPKQEEAELTLIPFEDSIIDTGGELRVKNQFGVIQIVTIPPNFRYPQK